MRWRRDDALSRPHPGEMPYTGSRARPSRWPWLVAAIVALAISLWLLRSPSESSLSRYRAMAEAQLPAQRMPTQRAIESGRVDPLKMGRTTRTPTSALPSVRAAGATPDDTRARTGADPAFTPAEAAEARRRADEAIKVIEAATPEM